MISIHHDSIHNHLYSTSKDNFINQYDFVEQQDEGGYLSASSTTSVQLGTNPSHLPKIHKVQQIKEEELNIIYNLFQQGSSLVLFGFYGNYAFLWDQRQSMQLFTVDTKGGNRPIRVAVRQTDQQAFGRLFAMGYAFGDKLVV